MKKFAIFSRKTLKKYIHIYFQGCLFAVFIFNVELISCKKQSKFIFDKLFCALMISNDILIKDQIKKELKKIVINIIAEINILKTIQLQKDGDLALFAGFKIFYIFKK